MNHRMLLFPGFVERAAGIYRQAVARRQPGHIDDLQEWRSLPRLRPCHARPPPPPRCPLPPSRPTPRACRCTAPSSARCCGHRGRQVAARQALPSETDAGGRWACRWARCGGGRRTGGRAHPGAPPGPRHLRRHAHQRPLPVPVLPRRARRRAARGARGRAAGFERTAATRRPRRWPARPASRRCRSRTGCACRAGRWCTTGWCCRRRCSRADREALARTPSTIYHLYQTEFGITVVRAHERPARWPPTATPRACWAWRRGSRCCRCGAPR
jgi:hypothetical protein